MGGSDHLRVIMDGSDHLRVVLAKRQRRWSLQKDKIRYRCVQGRSLTVRMKSGEVLNVPDETEGGPEGSG